jgi:hypothetical protein
LGGGSLLRGGGEYPNQASLQASGSTAAYHQGPEPEPPAAAAPEYCSCGSSGEDEEE